MTVLGGSGLPCLLGPDPRPGPQVLGLQLQLQFSQWENQKIWCLLVFNTLNHTVDSSTVWPWILKLKLISNAHFVCVAVYLCRYGPHQDADPFKPRVPALIHHFVAYKNQDHGAWLRGGDVWLDDCQWVHVLTPSSTGASVGVVHIKQAFKCLLPVLWLAAQP